MEEDFSIIIDEGDCMEPFFKVTFYESDGRLVRLIEVSGMFFWEQFDWDGWYGYHARAFVEIDERQAIDLALGAIHFKHPDYINRNKVRFKLYEFCIEQLHYGHKAHAA
jgi:hypothetical protein